MRAKGNLTLYNFRLEPELIERLDRFAADLTDDGPIHISRVDALRILLKKGLSEHETGRKKRK